MVAGIDPNASENEDVPVLVGKIVTKFQSFSGSGVFCGHLRPEQMPAWTNDPHHGWLATLHRR